MTEILKRPDGPWRGFWQGAIGAALTMGPIFLVQALFAQKSGLEFWGRMELMLILTGGVALFCGVCLAVWRLIQCWAYDRYTDGPSH